MSSFERLSLVRQGLSYPMFLPKVIDNNLSEKKKLFQDFQIYLLIFQKLKEASGKETIPYDQLTYGQFFAFIKLEGLSICNELKIQSKYGKENTQQRRELRSLCEAFGFEKIQSPSTVRK